MVDWDGRESIYPSRIPTSVRQVTELLSQAPKSSSKFKSSLRAGESQRRFGLCLRKNADDDPSLAPTFLKTRSKTAPSPASCTATDEACDYRQRFWESAACVLSTRWGWGLAFRGA
jgi:hypothetical protein